MPTDHEPTVLGLLVDGQARLESALASVRAEMVQRADLARFEGELRGVKSRVESLEKTRLEHAATVSAHERVLTRREKLVAAVGGSLMLAGVWFGDTLANIVGKH